MRLMIWGSGYRRAARGGDDGQNWTSALPINVTVPNKVFTYVMGMSQSVLAVKDPAQRTPGQALPPLF